MFVHRLRLVFLLSSLFMVQELKAFSPLQQQQRRKYNTNILSTFRNYDDNMIPPPSRNYYNNNNNNNNNHNNQNVYNDDDVAYIASNINRQRSTYYAIRKVGGLDCVNDLYARDPTMNSGRTKFWFIGKVARCTGTVSLAEAVARQYNLIEEHAIRLRPVELGRAYGRIEVWAAPADSEYAISNNDPSVPMIPLSRFTKVVVDHSVDLIEVGLNLEVVRNYGEGFFVERDDDGRVPMHLRP